MRNIERVWTSPLQYVGGKYWAVNHILDVIPSGTRELVSPFFGGGCVELNLAHAFGMRVYASDLDKHLVNFWQHFLPDASGFVEKCKAVLETHTRNHLKGIKKVFDDIPDDAERAVFYYVFSRLSMMGQPLSDSYVNRFWKQDGEWRRADKAFKQNRTEQNRTEQNRTEQNRTEQNRRGGTLGGKPIMLSLLLINLVRTARFTHYLHT